LIRNYTAAELQAWQQQQHQQQEQVPAPQHQRSLKRSSRPVTEPALHEEAKVCIGSTH
jgi:hypothetical protein